MRILQYLQRNFQLSRTEANGFFLLIIVLIMSLLGITWIKYSTPYPTGAHHDERVLDSLLREIERNVVYDTINRSGYKRNLRKTVTLRNEKYKDPYRDAPAKRMTAPRSRSYQIDKFDINLADTSQLKRLRGIGAVLSKRIVKYRDLLGGFVDKNQYRDVYGLQDSVIAQLDTLTFVNTSFQPKGLQINKLEDRELSRHPYLKPKQAKAIVAYRIQHGAFSQVSDLKVIKLLDSLTLARITPYVEF